MEGKLTGMLLELPEYNEGNTYVCGDIHGCFEDLEEALSEAGFDKAHDRLICCGDLIDRGPDSHLCVGLIEQPWFVTVRGNHEDLALSAIRDPSDRRARMLWYQNGGNWYGGAENPLVADEVAEAFKDLPLGIEAIVDGKTFAIIHADPVTFDWEVTKEAFRHASDGDHVYMCAIWNRSNVEENVAIRNCDVMIHGHTIQKEPTTRGNRLFLDTGSFLKHWDGEDGHISVVCLNDLAKEV